MDIGDEEMTRKESLDLVQIKVAGTDFDEPGAGGCELNDTTQLTEQPAVSGGPNIFEDIIHAIGHRGRFQILMMTFILLVTANSAMINVNTVFTLLVPLHR